MIEMGFIEENGKSICRTTVSTHWWDRTDVEEIDHIYNDDGNTYVEVKRSYAVPSSFVEDIYYCEDEDEDEDDLS